MNVHFTVIPTFLLICNVCALCAVHMVLAVYLLIKMSTFNGNMMEQLQVSFSAVHTLCCKRLVFEHKVIQCNTIR